MIHHVSYLWMEGDWSNLCMIHHVSYLWMERGVGGTGVTSV